VAVDFGKDLGHAPVMRKITVSALSGVVLILAGCGDSAPAVDKAAIEKSVRAVEAAMGKAAAAKDAGAFAANYTADAVMMTPFQPPMKTRDAIKNGIGEMLKDPALKLDFSSDRIEVSDSGDMAAVRGTYTMAMTATGSKEVMNDHGSYVTVFRKQADGSWKAVLDINTSEVAPAPPAPPKPEPKVVKKGRRR
jgi:uncharacterized protein (TIGR02246 family)